MEVKLYFRMLQRSWWIILLTALTAALAALTTAYFTTPMFKASSRYIVAPNPSALGGQSNVIYSLDTLDKRSVITTYAEILNSPRIYTESLTNLGVADLPDIHQYNYGAVVLPDTNIIEFSVIGPTPSLVAAITNETGQRAVQYVEGLYQVYDMTLLDSAAVPTTPISPQPIRDTSVALVVGLAIGVALALVREVLRAPIIQFVRDRKIDPVSHAMNRSEFEVKLEDLAFASVADLSLCIVHLNGLKEYIHVLPLPTLEIVLRHVTQVLKDQLRGNDLVGRWDELDFIVLLSQTSGTAALNTMGRVQSALSLPIHIDISGEDLYLQPKLGIAEYRVGDTATSFLKNTNWALDIAKKSEGIYLLKATELI